MPSFKELMQAAPYEMDTATAQRWYAEYDAKHVRPEKPPEGTEQQLEAAAKAACIARGQNEPLYRFKQPSMLRGEGDIVVRRWGEGSPYLQWWRARYYAMKEFEKMYWPAIWASKVIAEIRKKV